MRKFVLAVAIIIPLLFISGIALIVIGGTQNEPLALAGSMIMSLGLPIVMVILVGVGLVIMITGGASVKKNDKGNEQDDNVSEIEKEYSNIAEINTSNNYIENRTKNAEYVGNHSANIYRNSSTTVKILGWIFLGFLLTNVILALIFAFFGNKLGMFICFGLFVGTIIISAICKFISEKVSMSAKVYTGSKKREVLDGKVKHCFLSSTKSVSVGSRHPISRVVDVTYRVVITANGKDYNAYTKDFYETGDDVKIAVLGGSRVKIVTEEELKESESLLK